MKKIIIICCFLFFISGCYDYQELNDSSIVSGIGIDYKDGKYIVDLEITKSSKDGSSTEIETFIVSGSNADIAEAFTEAKNHSDKLVYMQHVEILVLGEELCNKGIGEVLDYMIRDPKINNNYFMVVTDNPNELLSKKIENKSISEIIVNTVEYYLENTTLDDIDIIASNMLNQRLDIALPQIYMEENNVIFNNFVYFNNDKAVDVVNSKMYTFLKLDSTNINFTYGNNTVGVYKKKVDYEVNDDDEVTIKVNAYASIKEIDKNIDLEEPKSYEELEDKVSSVIKKEVEEFIDETLNKDSDLLGLEDIYYKKYKRSPDNLRYKVDVKLTINKNGTIYGVLYDN